MQNFHDIFKTCKQSFISVFQICMTLPLSSNNENTVYAAYSVVAIKTLHMHHSSSEELNISYFLPMSAFCLELCTHH